MARLESPQKHTRDNMRVLKEIENSAYYSKLMHNMVLDLLDQVDEASTDLAKQLEAETAVMPIQRENGRIVMPCLRSTTTDYAITSPKCC